MFMNFFDKKIDTIYWKGKDYPIKENMCLKFPRYKVNEEKYYLVLRGIDKIANFFEMSTLFGKDLSFEICYEGDGE